MKYKGLGICEWSLPIVMRGPVALKLVKEAGLNAIELELGIAEENFPLANPYVIENFKEAKEEYKVTITGVAANMTDFFPMVAPSDDSGRQLVEIAMKKAVDSAEELGAALIHAPSFNMSQINTLEDMKNTADCFRKICDYAADKGIMVCTENNLDAEKQLQEIEMINKDNFGVYFDTQNYYCAGLNTKEIVSSIGDYIREVHVKDGFEEVSSYLLGQGGADVFGTLEALESIGYEGWLLFENYYSKKPLCGLDDDFMQILKKDVDILEGWLESR